MQLDAEQRKAEVLREFGMDELPPPLYDDLPAAPDPSTIREVLNFRKALMLVDDIATAAFYKYLPARCVIDQQIDPRAFKRGWSFSIVVRTDVPPPVDAKMARITGIQPLKEDKYFMIWLADGLDWQYQEMGARAMSPPLIWRTNGFKGSVPCMGLSFTLDRTPPPGLTSEDLMRDVGFVDVRSQGDTNCQPDDKKETA